MKCCCSSFNEANFSDRLIQWSSHLEYSLIFHTLLEPRRRGTSPYDVIHIKGSRVNSADCVHQYYFYCLYWLMEVFLRLLFFSSGKSTNKVAVRDFPKIIMILRTFSSPPMYISSDDLNTLQIGPLENVNLYWSYTF